MDFFNQNSMNCDASSISMEEEQKESVSTEVSDYDLDYAIQDDDGVMYSVDGKRLLDAQGALTSECYHIKEGTEVICDFAFEGSSIEQVELPASITTIGNNPFEPYKCKVESKSSRFIVENGMLIDVQKGRLISFLDSDDQDRIIFPESVKIIGSYAFSECTLPDKFVLPSTIKSIEKCAFYDPDGKELVLPSSLTNIDYSPFEYINETPLHIISESARFVVRDQMLLDLQEDRLIVYFENEGDEKVSVVIPESIRSIAPYAFEECNSICRITLPSSLISIEKYAFEECSSLININLPPALENIGNFAFETCDNLKKLILPASLKSIGDNPFNCGVEIVSESSRFIMQDGYLIDLQDGRLISCFVPVSQLSMKKDCVIPEIVKSIGNNVFCDDADLNSITLPDSLTSIGDNAFKGSGLKAFTMPSSLVSIGNRAFENTCLETISFPESLTRIGDYAFFGTHLVEVSFPDSLTSIGKRAFQLTPIKKIVFPASLETIEDYVCIECENLREVVLPSSLKSIGEGAFADCTHLEKVVLPDTLLSIGYGAFSYCKSLVNIKLPSSLASIGENPFQLSEGLKIESNSRQFAVRDGMLIDTKAGHLIAYVDTKQVVTIPKTVSSIGKNAFYCSRDLKVVIIPPLVKNISEDAFHQCASLKMLIIPKGSKNKFKKILPKELSEKLYEKEFPIDGTMPKYYPIIDGIGFFISMFRK